MLYKGKLHDVIIPGKIDWEKDSKKHIANAEKTAPDGSIIRILNDGRCYYTKQFVSNTAPKKSSVPTAK